MQVDRQEENTKENAYTHRNCRFGNSPDLSYHFILTHLEQIFG